MPALSSTMTEGKIVEWLKNPGDKVERGESVLVVESDKADMDVESFQDGYLAAVLMPAGSTAPVGETIGLIVENEDEIASVQEQNKGNQPEVSTSDQLELVSNKTEEKPIVQTENIKKEAEEVVLKSEKPAPSFNVDQINAATSNVSSRIIASPRAKKLASQMGVDLAKVHGSGPVARAAGPWLCLAEPGGGLRNRAGRPDRRARLDPARRAAPCRSRGAGAGG